MSCGLPAFSRLSARWQNIVGRTARANDERTAGEKPAARWYTNLETALGSPKMLSALLPPLQQAGFRIGPLVLAEQARVALGDEVGHLLRARLVLVRIGERPGLSAPDSLGAYFTYGPRPGLTDKARNCVANSRPTGLAYPAAAATPESWLLRAAPPAFGRGPERPGQFAGRVAGRPRLGRQSGGH